MARGIYLAVATGEALAVGHSNLVSDQIGPAPEPGNLTLSLCGATLSSLTPLIVLLQLKVSGKFFSKLSKTYMLLRDGLSGFLADRAE